MSIDKTLQSDSLLLVKFEQVCIFFFILAQEWLLNSETERISKISLKCCVYIWLILYEKGVWSIWKKKKKGEKSIDPGRPALSAQADLSQYVFSFLLSNV